MAKKEGDGRSIPRDVLEHARFRAIALREKGWPVQRIAEATGVHRCTVSDWISLYKKFGRDSLKKRKAPGPKRKLEVKEIKRLLDFLKKPATELGFETPLWDCPRLGQLIKKKFGKELHPSNVWRLLKALGLSPQVPEKKASQQDEEEVKKWLAQEWPKIKQHARRWQAIIYFQDECGVSLIPVLGRTWAPKGQTPIVECTGKRGGICVTSAISPAGKMVFRLEKEKIKASQHIEFLEQIIKHHPKRKIIVIEDRAPPHIAKKVSQFVEEHRKRFAIYRIPSYSPQLNPDEKTWRYLKKHKLRSHQAQTTEDFRPLVLAKMRSIQQQPRIIKSFFNGTYVL